MKSILQYKKECYLSGSTQNLESHHIFAAANRKLSERYGLKVWLTHELHNEPPYGAHHSQETRLKLQQAGQRAFEGVHGTREEFMEIFGRNYLD